MTTTQPASVSLPATTLGDYAYRILEAQYRQILKHEKKVLADQDPEHLHHMRVGTRRLRVALQVFADVIQLPKVAGETRLRDLARTLGELRDLDVHQAALQQDYYPLLNQTEQTALDQVLKGLQKERRRAFAKVKTTLAGSRYQKLKAAYDDWLEHPQWTAIAHLPLPTVLPDLLSPLLASLLLHPGWLLPTEALVEAEGPMHDLRKACKRVRYQTEFFQSFYGDRFKTWLDDIKQIQEVLGQVHDAQVLQQVLAEHLPSSADLSGIQQAIAQQQTQALTSWEPLRQKYLDPEFRQQLRRMILELEGAIATPTPTAATTPVSDKPVRKRGKAKVETTQP